MILFEAFKTFFIISILVLNQTEISEHMLYISWFQTIPRLSIDILYKSYTNQRDILNTFSPFLEVMMLNLHLLFPLLKEIYQNSSVHQNICKTISPDKAILNSKQDNYRLFWKSIIWSLAKRNLNYLTI